MLRSKSFSRKNPTSTIIRLASWLRNMELRTYLSYERTTVSSITFNSFKSIFLYLVLYNYNRIVTRQFHNVFYDSSVYPSYTPQRQSQLLEEIEKFVASNFGRDSDLAKTIRFLNLVILYN